MQRTFSGHLSTQKAFQFILQLTIVFSVILSSFLPTHSVQVQASAATTVRTETEKVKSSRQFLPEKASPVIPEFKNRLNVVQSGSRSADKNNANLSSPTVGVRSYCPPGFKYCYRSDSGYFSVADSVAATNPERVLSPGGDCCGLNATILESDYSFEDSPWVIYDLGEVFEITRFLSRDYHQGNWAVQYSEDGTDWVVFGKGDTTQGNAACQEYLYDVSTDPVNARYIRYKSAYSTIAQTGGYLTIAWFTFESNTPSKNHPPILPQNILSGTKTKNGNGDERECRLNTNACDSATGSVGDPVNTLTGSFDYAVADLSIPTAAGPLVFQRSYASGAIGLNLYIPHTDTTLGYGWAHNQDIRLTFPSADQVWFKGESANQYLFTKNEDGTYKAYPGVTAAMRFDSDNNKYILVDAGQNAYTFDDSGKILRWTNANGQSLVYSYNTDNLLSRVADSRENRYLDFTYTNGLLTVVSDNSGRDISYRYDDRNDLVDYKDVLDNHWGYVYDGHHHLMVVTLTNTGSSPKKITLVRNLYDYQGRVVCQQEGDTYAPLTQYSEAGVCEADGSPAIATSITYTDQRATLIKDANGHVTTHHYNGNGNLLSGETNPLEEPTDRTLDGNFRPTSITNPAGAKLQMSWSADGANLLETMDPENNKTTKEYDVRNNLTKVIDPLNNETTYTYDGQLMTSMTDALHQTTTYTYTIEGELSSKDQPQPGGLLKTVTDPANRTTHYEYDALGQKIAETDALNHTTRYTYDSLGRMVDIVDPQGRVTHNEYNAAGWLLRTTRNYIPARQQNDQNLYNLVTEYYYDALGHQTLVRDTLGHETKYAYDNNGRLVTTTNALNQTITNIYDGTGVLVETIDAAGNHTIYERDAAGRPVSTRDPLGHGSTNGYETKQNISYTIDALGNENDTYFDKNNRIVKIYDAMWNGTTTTYDGNGNVVTKTDPLGRVTFYEYDPLNRVKRQTQNYKPGSPQNDQGQYNIVTEYTYDAAGNQIQVKDTLGRITYSEYDPYGRLVRQTQNYDSSRPQNDQGQYNIVTIYGYDENGNQNRVTDTFGRVTYSMYDLLGRLQKQTQNYDPNRPKSDQNQYNLVTEYRYDALGNQSQVIDPSGRVNLKEYDALGRLVRQTQNYDANRTQNDQNQFNIVTTFEYDALGHQYRVTDTYGRVTYNEYDIAGQLVRTTRNYDTNRPQNDENQYNIVTGYEYDKAGHVVKEIDTYGKATFYEYDKLGRKKSQTENCDTDRPQNAGNEYNLVTRYEYDSSGHQTDESNPNGVVTHFEYDALGRLVASMQNYQAGVNPTAEINVRIEYTYDALGNRLTRMDPRGNSTAYTYDALNRLIAETKPLLHATSYVYDALGRQTSKIDGNGKVINYTYDALGRQTAIDYPTGEADVNYTYNLQGQPLTMSDGSGTTTWTYDLLGQVTSFTNADGAKVAYTYDAMGNRLTVTTHIDASDLTGKMVTYAYDALNRQISVTDWQGQQTRYDYDALGRLTSIHRPNGVDSSYAYNSAGRLTGLAHSRAGVSVAEYEYQYDPVGNRIFARENQETVRQLIYLPFVVNEPDNGTMGGALMLDGIPDAAAAGPTEMYPAPAVDAGSLQDEAYPSPGGDGATENAAPAASLEDSYPAPGSFSQGVPVSEEIKIQYGYDALNRLKTASYDTGVSFSYIYDAAGNSLQTIRILAGQTKTTVYTYDADNQLATSQTDGGTVWQYRFDGNGSLVENAPGSQVGNGAKRYTYNTAGELTRIEAHDGTAYRGQAEMAYNGQSQRLALTAHQDGQSLTTHYLLNGDTLIAATANGQTTYYLNGIGEEQAAWSYYLQDGSNTVRQMADAQGEVRMTRSFTPWGELLEQTGTGNLTWGYLGGVLDAATGLIYVGNGQYYDPATGRFLSRGVNPGATNPYMPWQGNPSGMIIAPLALLAVIRGKRKAGKIDQFLVVLIVVAVVSLTLTGCNTSSRPPQPPTSTSQPTMPTSTGTAEPTGTNESGDGEGSAAQSPTETLAPPPPCPTDTPPPPPPSTPLPKDYDYITFTYQKLTEYAGWWNNNDARNPFSYIDFLSILFRTEFYTASNDFYGEKSTTGANDAELVETGVGNFYFKCDNMLTKDDWTKSGVCPGPTDEMVIRYINLRHILYSEGDNKDYRIRPGAVERDIQKWKDNKPIFDIQDTGSNFKAKLQAPPIEIKHWKDYDSIVEWGNPSSTKYSGEHLGSAVKGRYTNDYSIHVKSGVSSIPDFYAFTFCQNLLWGSNPTAIYNDDFKRCSINWNQKNNFKKP